MVQPNCLTKSRKAFSNSFFPVLRNFSRWECSNIDISHTQSLFLNTHVLTERCPLIRAQDTSDIDLLKTYNTASEEGGRLGGRRQW